MEPKSVVSVLILIVTLIAAAKLLNWLWLRPRSLEKFLRNQGLRGNPYSFPLGDLGDVVSVFRHRKSLTIQITDNAAAHSLAYYLRHRIKYGENPFIWFGPNPKLVITDPQLIREIVSRPDVFQKKRPDPIGETVTGGLLYLEDEKWAKHRRIVAPAFHADRLKGMAPAMRLSCLIMVEKWQALFGDGPMEIDVWPWLQDLAGDVISRTAFGSSHHEGRRIFELQSELVKLVLEILQFIFIPGWRYVPTKTNRRVKTISKEIRTLLRGIISRREKAMLRGEPVGEDFLGMLMESNFGSKIQGHKNKKTGLSIEDVIEECNLFYFAGSETTSSLLVWTMVMLSVHQEWQDRAREEVVQVFGTNEPTTFDGLSCLKIVTMILYEVMRLYAPVPVIARAPTKAVELGNMRIPAGLDLILVIGLLHNDPKIWGDDANEFKPDRLTSKSRFAFMPFSSGPRVCIGHHYAMVEVKTALAMILQRFRFELSPNYLHAPFSILTLQPQNGASLLLHKL